MTMFGDVKLEKAIAFARISVALTYCCPPRFAATKSQILRFKILRTAVMLNAFTLLFPLLYALYVQRDNPTNFVEAACLTMAVLQVLVQTIFCISQYDRLRRLIEEMITYCEAAKIEEKYVLQRYVQKYSSFYGVTSIWVYASACTVVVGSMLSSQPFPTKAEYPFAVDYEPLRTIIFLHQALVGVQCAAHGCMNVLSALLLLFAAARFEILMMELRKVTDVEGLIKGVKKYHSVKRYAMEVVRSVQFIAVITIAICGVALVLCGVNFLGRHPFAVKVQFLCLAGTTSMEMFMCAWPADQLMEISENVTRGAYESAWYRQTLRLQKDVLHMVAPQKAVGIRVKCFVPILSLSYFCSYMSNLVSMFTALRVAIVKYEDDS